MGHLWRTSGDIYSCFDCEKKHDTWSSWGVIKIMDIRKNIRQYSGPDHWNDPEMMEVINGMTATEDKTHFSLWAMLSAPLIAGNNLRTMNKTTVDILTNQEMIAIDQDALGIQSFIYESSDIIETWVKPLSNGEWEFCFLNRSQKPMSVNFNRQQHVITDSISKTVIHFKIEQYLLRNLWKKAGVGNNANPYKTTLAAHDVVMLRLTKTNLK